MAKRTERTRTHNVKGPVAREKAAKKTKQKKNSVRRPRSDGPITLRSSQLPALGAEHVAPAAEQAGARVIPFRRKQCPNAEQEFADATDDTDDTNEQFNEVRQTQAILCRELDRYKDRLTRLESLAFRESSVAAAE